MTYLARQLAEAFDLRMVQESSSDPQFCGSISVTCHFRDGMQTDKMGVTVQAVNRIRKMQEQAA